MFDSIESLRYVNEKRLYQPFYLATSFKTYGVLFQLEVDW